MFFSFRDAKHDILKNMENSVHGKLSDEKKDKVFSVLWLTNLVRMVAGVSLGGVIIFL